VLHSALGEGASYHELDAARFALPKASRTFHGRDILAPAAAAIAGGLAPKDAAVSTIDAPVRLALAPTQHHGDADSLETEVLVADHFGNLILGVSAREMPAPAHAWTLSHAGREIGFKDTYALADPGEALLLVDSFGSVELAVRDGSAAAVLGLSPGDRLTLRRRS
jgi:S-adenosylmethionine hydrolase